MSHIPLTLADVVAQTKALDDALARRDHQPGQDRLSLLEARVALLEARLAQLQTPVPVMRVEPPPSTAWPVTPPWRITSSNA